MGEKARLRAQLIEAQQQRDRAITRAERAEAAEAAAIAEANRLRVQQPSLVDQARDRALRWLDELAQAVGL
jgi:hypothetical protein